MPTLVFVSERYPPDPASAGQHLSDLAEYLAAKGWSVEVVTGSSRSDGGHVDAPAREIRHGVAIRRLRTLGVGRASRLGRVVTAAAFYLRLVPILWRARAHSRVVFLTSPPMVYVLGPFTGVRYGIWSLDHHPEAEVAAGMLRRGGMVARVLQAWSAAAYRRADFVITIGTYMRARVESYGVEGPRLHVIPVWAECEDSGVAQDSPASWRARLGLADKFVAMYSGNAGHAHTFATILEAMRVLRDDPEVFFLFVGNGPKRRAIETYMAVHEVRNCAYLPYFARAEVPAALAAADAHLVSLNASFVGVSVPGKTFGVMAVGRPILFVGPMVSEVGELVRGARCGEVVEPEWTGGAVRLATIIREWAAHPEAAREAGWRGQAVWRERYRRDANCLAMENVIRETWT